jgi:hypothetical protein
VADWIIGTLTALISQFEQENAQFLIESGWEPDYIIAPGNYTFRVPPCTHAELHDLGVELFQRQQEPDTSPGPVMQDISDPTDAGGARQVFNTEMRRWLKIRDSAKKLFIRVRSSLSEEGRMQWAEEMTERREVGTDTGTSATKRLASNAPGALDVWKRAREE